jgi:hypothetical protein
VILRGMPVDQEPPSPVSEPGSPGPWYEQPAVDFLGNLANGHLPAKDQSTAQCASDLEGIVTPCAHQISRVFAATVKAFKPTHDVQRGGYWNHRTDLHADRWKIRRAALVRVTSCGDRRQHPCRACSQCSDVHLRIQPSEPLFRWYEVFHFRRRTRVALARLFAGKVRGQASAAGPHDDGRRRSTQ